MPTPQECKSKLFRIGMRLGVSPALISTRLLSTEDKHDMVNGLIDTATLETGVKVWVDAGMPDYAKGSTERYEWN
jgi:hypothetical protein